MSARKHSKWLSVMAAIAGIIEAVFLFQTEFLRNGISYCCVPNAFSMHYYKLMYSVKVSCYNQHFCALHFIYMCVCVSVYYIITNREAHLQPLPHPSNPSLYHTPFSVPPPTTPPRVPLPLSLL